MSSLGIDYGRLEEAKRRLERAGELVDTIRDAARALDELVDDPDDPVAYALDTADRLAPALPSPPSAPAPQPRRGDATAAPAPAPLPRRRGRREVASDTVGVVLDYLEAHPREWLRTVGIAAALGIHNKTVKAALDELCATGTAEHNGRRTAASRWRLDPGLADELERPDVDEPEPDEDLILPAEPEPVDVDVDVDEPEARVDVKRELERLSGLAPPRRSAVNPPSPPSANGRLTGVGTGVAMQGPQGTARDELKDRVRAHLLEEASTISELALALDVPRRDLAPVVLELAQDGDEPIVPVAGAFRNRGETIYSNVS